MLSSASLKTFWSFSNSRLTENLEFLNVSQRLKCARYMPSARPAFNDENETSNLPMATIFFPAGSVFSPRTWSNSLWPFSGGQVFEILLPKTNRNPEVNITAQNTRWRVAWNSTQILWDPYFSKLTHLRLLAWTRKWHFGSFEQEPAWKPFHVSLFNSVTPICCAEPNMKSGSNKKPSEQVLFQMTNVTGCVWRCKTKALPYCLNKIMM